MSESYVEQCMKKMQEWMELRAFAPVTLSVYTRCARRFIEHIGKPLGAVKTEILSGSEVKRLLKATTSLKYRAVFMLAYGAGLRVSELAALETTDHR